jgi:hypothetical protein
VESKGKVVRLRRKNGRIVSLTIAQWSLRDQRFPRETNATGIFRRRRLIS